MKPTAHWQNSAFPEIAVVLVRRDHIASMIVYADDCRARAGVTLRVTDSGSSVDKVPAAP
jgi:hypothetical protein